MRVELVSGGTSVEAIALEPSGERKDTLVIEREARNPKLRWYVDDVLWFEQPLALSARNWSVCGQTCVSYDGVLTLPTALPDGTEVESLLPDCAAMACRDKVVVELATPVSFSEFTTVQVGPPDFGMYECRSSCSGSACTFGVQPSAGACETAGRSTLSALTYWGRAEELVARGVVEQDGAELSFTRTLQVEPDEPHLPSAPAGACSPGCFVGRATLEWPERLRGGSAGAPGR
jgi:hypothetical protein